MKKDLEYCTSDKVNWYKNHSMSEEQRKKLIEDKIKRALKQVELEGKTKVLSK
jgi:predicted aldo/keto reductase-like oxidoreductase